MATENKINGMMIISFEIDSLKNPDNFKYIKPLGGGLEPIVESSIRRFTLINSLASSDSGSKLTYFLALKFDMVDANKFIEMNNAIPILKVHWDYIQQ